MFTPSDHPRLFGLPPGADFPEQLVAGILSRTEGMAPEALARVEVFVNTRRMQRRMRDILSAGPARLLPRIRLITDLSHDIPLPGVGPAVPPLRRRLEISQLIGRALDADPTLAPRSALFALSDSLADLMDEMRGEGVGPEALRNLDVSDESGHWARSLAFIDIVEHYFAADAEPDSETRQRRAVEHLARLWDKVPPAHPVIVAGSTGSRGATALFMEAVARLPQGAVVLPGYDFELPDHVWDRLTDPLSSEDHPQYRFHKLKTDLGLPHDGVAHWTDADPVSRRNGLLSLALRPAPVTDQWLTEGQAMDDLPEAVTGISLIEAPSPRREALAIALRLRQAAEDGQTAALITPDRNLTRQVTAALDRWRIEPDDSAGRPLGVSAPGRFLRHIVRLMGQRMTSEALLTLLKHPLCNTGSGNRGKHLLWTRELELTLRRHGPAFPTAESVAIWAAKREDGADAWAAWLGQTLFALEHLGDAPLEEQVALHRRVAEALSAGPASVGSGELWEKAAGAEALSKVEELQREASAGGVVGMAEYTDLFDAVLARGEVRDPIRPHPGIMIWGTLEARVQGADLVILGGLNDGVWPELPPPDPWLNRRMRKDAGLLLPERRVGLSAHDFQQAAASPEVVLSRSVRDAEAETVMSRWLNRLTNLLAGLPEQGGEMALRDMRKRGKVWLDRAEALEARYERVEPEPRPAPRPPVAARPRKLSVTRIQTLIRDPYAIYARSILRLKPLDPLRPGPDAPLRGIVLHEIFDRFLREGPAPDDPAARDALLKIADDVLEAEVPWPAARRIWHAKLARVADWFLAGEVERQARAQPFGTEKRGEMHLGSIDFTLNGQADRIDRRDDGQLVIYDYKTGQPPSEKQIRHFDKQLLLEAAMAEAGAFEGVPKARVAEVAHIGVGGSPKVNTIPLRDFEADEPLDPDQILREFFALISAYDDPSRGYTSRRSVMRRDFEGDYDHLARHKEWDDSDPAHPVDVE
ncbi:double-strand break repair protein AddB [Tranquillimonas alkanivorans]|uniref:Double-strand break repair protein AddB n=1 Tax=Tranquillimonas alkanivorans TaxID=441119 RepID=A0A1I5LLI7_9RHOB|nr:double-strand break repair protein AddB [Tranquillimonas alkanivorans]SFO98130.1 double-strand break repair protein AddB [Tranquillimonas alkanivorans]